MTTRFIILTHLIFFFCCGFVLVQSAGSGIWGDLYHITDPKMEQFKSGCTGCGANIRQTLPAYMIKRYLLL
jgi:hypothetical protein